MKMDILLILINLHLLQKLINELKLIDGYPYDVI